MSVSANKPPVIEEFQFGPWNISTTKSRILNAEESDELLKDLELPHLPDMLFIHNRLELKHEEGLSLKMEPVEALRGVNAHEDLIQVSMAQDWQEARKNSPYINKVVHPYDWTFTTSYSGTLEHQTELRIEETEEKINYEKLKIKEKILFFDELVLYEDELDDNGCTKLIAKIRVMPSGFFILLRFHLRVDNTLIRVYDTRIYHEIEKDYLLREYSEREDATQNLSVDRQIWSDPNLIVDHLPLKLSKSDKIYL
eukprot:TRINITY_DN22193_c0_g1_i1.p1 TRINITY_DN22193_c0_g1~~TRINITY_DN22193_c0_g1_i1.p1  ORF type:complete len:254 (+),score=40.68 TRINITY_DN22193_c0_g1_i1:36-797(+)